VREKERCRSSKKQFGEATTVVATHVAFSSEPDALFTSGCETGVDLLEVAQHVLFAQQAGRHALLTATSETMQLRAETWNGDANRATAMASEIVIWPNIELPCSTT
jgi:hypothetical protein